jgi:FkbM family methyltransferase
MMYDYEAMLERYYTTLLQPGNACIDVGAHTGRHTLPMAARVGPTGHVYAFEPVPTIAEVLRTKLAKLPSGLVTFEQCALADTSGQADFVFVRDNPGYSGLRRRHYDTPVTTETIQVQVRRLDDLMTGMPRITYVKIDCEGGELRVLRGAAALLDRDRPTVSFECGNASLESYDYDAADIYDYWSDHHYQVQSITGLLLDRNGFVSACARQEYWDYIARP